MTSWPSSASMAAATDESTPPDMATAIRIFQRSSSATKTRRHEENLVFRAAQDLVFLRVFVSSWLDNSPSSEIPELLDKPGHHGDDPIDLLFGREHPQTEPQRVLRPVL